MLDQVAKLLDQAISLYEAKNITQSIIRFEELSNLATATTNPPPLTSSITSTIDKDEEMKMRKFVMDLLYQCSVEMENLADDEKSEERKRIGLLRALRFINCLVQFDDRDKKIIYRRGHLWHRLGDDEKSYPDFEYCKIIN